MGVFDHDLRTNAVYCSPEVHELYGWPEGLVATVEMFDDYTHPDDRAQRTAAVAAPTTATATAATASSTASSAPAARCAG